MRVWLRAEIDRSGSLKGYGVADHIKFEFSGLWEGSPVGRLLKRLQLRFEDGAELERMDELIQRLYSLLRESLREGGSLIEISREFPSSEESHKGEHKPRKSVYR